MIAATDLSSLAVADTASSRALKFTFARSFEEKYISSFSSWANAEIPVTTASRDIKKILVFINRRIDSSVNNVNLLNRDIFS